MDNRIKLGIVGLGRAGWGMHVSELKSKESMYGIKEIKAKIQAEKKSLKQERSM